MATVKKKTTKKKKKNQSKKTIKTKDIDSMYIAPKSSQMALVVTGSLVDKALRKCNVEYKDLPSGKTKYRKTPVLIMAGNLKTNKITTLQNVEKHFATKLH